MRAQRPRRFACSILRRAPVFGHNQHFPPESAWFASLPNLVSSCAGVVQLGSHRAGGRARSPLPASSSSLHRSQRGSASPQPLAKRRAPFRFSSPIAGVATGKRLKIGAAWRNPWPARAATQHTEWPVGAELLFIPLGGPGRAGRGVCAAPSLGWGMESAAARGGPAASRTCAPRGDSRGSAAPPF